MGKYFQYADISIHHNEFIYVIFFIFVATQSVKNVNGMTNSWV